LVNVDLNVANKTIMSVLKILTYIITASYIIMVLGIAIRKISILGYLIFLKIENN